MFDSTTFKSETKVVAVTKEIEKTISPDKVTDMYKAVREQAEKDIIASLRVEQNTLNGVVIQVADQYDTMTSRVRTRFILNGKEHNAEEVINKREVLTNEQMWEKLAAHFRETTAMTIFRDASAVLLRAFGKRT